MRELVASTVKQKPTIALTDPETNHGGLTLKEVRTQLLEADELYSKWDFNQDGPRGLELYEHLFSSEPIEWNRIGHFQVGNALQFHLLISFHTVKL